MSFKPGDKVKFLNEIGGGIIRYIKGNIAEVESEEGFLIPILLSELVINKPIDFKIKTSLNEFKDVDDIKEDDINIYKELEEEFDVFKFKQNYQKNKFIESEDTDLFLEKTNDELKLVLAIVPNSKGNIKLDSFDIYLINDCNFQLLYNFVQIIDSEYQYIQAGKLNEDTKIKLANYNYTELTKLNEFILSFIPYKVGKYTAIEQGLEVVPVLNKIDLPSAEPKRVIAEIEDVIGFVRE